MASSPFCTPCNSPSHPASQSNPTSPPTSNSLSLTPFSSSIPLRQPSGGKSFADALCNDPSFAHICGRRSNAFCHPLPESFTASQPGDSFVDGDVSVKKPSSYNGLPCIFLTNKELDILDKPLELTLIAKFPAGRPKWVSLNNYFIDLKLVGGIRINHYDARHIAIHFMHPDDYTRIFAKPVTTILGFAVKFLKWTRDFDIHQEPIITPIWISLPNLCLSFFTRNMLLSIASAYGKPLLIDPATAKGERPINARILVELNVLKQHPKHIWLGNDEFGYKQEVVIENLPKYCEFCCKYGHQVEQCYIKDPNLKKKKEDSKGKKQRNEIDEAMPTAGNPVHGNAEVGSQLGCGINAAQIVPPLIVEGC